MRFYITAIAHPDGKVNFEGGLAFARLAYAAKVARNVNRMAKERGTPQRVKVYSVGTKLNVSLDELVDMEGDRKLTDIREIEL